MRYLSSYFAALLFAGAMTACGPQPADLVPAGIGHKPPPDAPPRFNDRNDGIGVEGTTGTMDETDVRNVMAANMDGFNNCFARTAGSYVSGRVVLQFIIAQDGRVKTVSVEDSTLGSLKIEDCLLQSSRFLAFPPPTGGDNAKFLYPLEWNPNGARLSMTVDATWGYEALRKHDSEIQACRRAHTFDHPFYLTIYVGRRGLALSAGFHSKHVPEDGFAACVVQSLQEMRFSDPGQRIAKYTALVENLPEGRR